MKKMIGFGLVAIILIGFCVVVSDRAGAGDLTLTVTGSPNWGGDPAKLVDYKIFLPGYNQYKDLARAQRAADAANYNNRKVTRVTFAEGRRGQTIATRALLVGTSAITPKNCSGIAPSVSYKPFKMSPATWVGVPSGKYYTLYGEWIEFVWTPTGYVGVVKQSAKREIYQKFTGGKPTFQVTYEDRYPE